ncbi:MAG: hypothetical protein ACI909_002146 [Planctomycetota bacterium]|jgi:hypothetical protein
MSNKEAIEQIANCYNDKQLSLTVSAERPELAQELMKEIQLEAGDITLIIIIFDEYNDLNIANPVLWLNLVIDTCQGFEEARGYDEWRESEGYKDSDFYQSLYQQYFAVVPKIRNIIGTQVKAIDYYHIEFNTDIAKALRAYKL